MRKIKFRAWDKTRQCWQYFVITPTLKQLEENLITFGSPIHQHLRHSRDIEDIYFQYTGIHDKNGKEIYEGDVVQTHFDKTEQYEAYTEIGIVNITPYRTEIEDKKHGKYNKFFSHSEVIGNIYENPELLKTP